MVPPRASSTEQFLTFSPFFSSLKREEIHAVAAIARERSYARGRVIFQDGQDCEGFHIVRSGAVKVYKTTPDGRERIIFLAQPGQSFAEVAVFLGDGRYPASAQAARPSETLFFPRKEFLSLLQERRELCMGMLASLAHWTKHLVKLLSAATQEQADMRLARYLLELPSPGGAVALPLTKQNLASYLVMTPETFSRILRRWQDKKIVQVQGRKIRIANRAALARTASLETP